MRCVALTCSAAILLAACERHTPPSDNAPRWQLTPITTFVGQTFAQRFLRLRSVAMHRDGRLAVVDNGAHSVFLFTPDGGPGTPAGRFGAGSGEYKNPYSAAWLGDTLAVYDPEMNRVVFLKAGASPAGDSWTLGITGDNLVRLYPTSESKAYLRSVRREGDRFRSVFIGFINGRAVDTLAIADPPPLASGTVCHVANGRETYFAWPEAPVELVVPVRADGAIAVVRTDEYRVAVKGPAGDTLGVLRRDVFPVPLTDADWTKGLAAYSAFIEVNDPAGCDARPARPRFRTPIRAMTVSAEGDVWVTSIGRDGLIFDVFGLDGVLRATLNAPPHVTSVPIAVAGDRVALVTDEPGGAQSVQVYRIVR